MATKAGKQRRREAKECRPSRPLNIDYMEMESRSLVEICGTYRTKCGYCKPNTKTSVSYGLLAKRLTCADYQELIDRGWRRSGTFVYKPVMHETCCPQYTIRLDVTRFKHTKGHRQVLNRLNRYLDGPKDSGSTNTTASGHRESSDRLTSSAAGGINSNNTNGKRSKLDQARGALGGRQASSARGDSAHGDAQRQNSKMLGALSERVAAAAVCAVEGGAVPGLGLGPEWRSEVANWSRVRPIRNKKVPPSSGKFCSAVALSIASAARQRGWKGTDGAGGAVVIAEATAEVLRAGSNGSDDGALLSGLSVAPNGFINFEAKLGHSSTLAMAVFASRHSSCSFRGRTAILWKDVQLSSDNSSCSAFEGAQDRTLCRSNLEAPRNHAQRPPPSALHEARADGSLTPPATPPPPPGSTLQGSTLLSDAAPSSDRHSAANETPTKPITVNVDKVTGGGASSEGSEITEAATGGAKTALTSSDEVAALPSQAVPAGQMGTTGGEGSDGSFAATAAAARLEWIERQGNSDGLVDMEVSPATQSGVTTTEAPSSSSRTGLASLPPLRPEVGPHRMTVTTVPARVTDEVFRLYVKYQVSVHGDDPSEVTPGQFRRFLVDSPLIRETVGGTVIRPPKPLSRFGPTSRSAMVVDDAMEGVAQDQFSGMTEGYDSLSVPYGSYHQLYRIGGQLVAVGVVDILPKCLSSVYCFYDPDYRALALGKLTALKETEFVREAHAVRPALRDYYMGFYIHTCPKMSYKGSYTPSSLLCPERLTWVPIELCRPVLDTHKYARLSDLLESPPGAEMGNGNRRGGSLEAAGDCQQRHEADLEGAGGSPTTEQRSPGSGSYSPLSSLLPDGREVGQGRSRKVSPSSSIRPIPGDDLGTNSLSGGSGGGGGGGGMTTMAAAAARRAAARRAAAARAAADEASGMDDIPLMVGQPAFPVNLTALTPQSQALVRDVLRTYVAAIGSDLAKRVVLKLHD